MAEVYQTINGRRMDDYVAHRNDVQGAVGYFGMLVYANAINNLNRHHDQYHATIEYERWDTDRAIILSDERGQKAAMSMEYGRGPQFDGGRGGMDPLSILHDAAGLSMDANRPRSRRYKSYVPKGKWK